MPAPSILRPALVLLACLPPGAAMPVPPDSATPGKEVRVTAQAKGSFEVKVAPLTDGARAGAWSPGRMSIDKRFKGDLDGTSQGEMLTAMTEVQGSAGYTAIEQVRGTLQGRGGSFLLQHFAVMTRGVPGEWTVMVVPDSGTGDLKGLAGTMTIVITGGQHTYTLDYTLPARP